MSTIPGVPGLMGAGMDKRASGILLHITSLPGPYGIGDLGPSAYRFADFLAAAGQSYWQILPLNYTHQSFYNSPYSCVSAFAGNPLVISPELMVEDGLLTREEAAPSRQFSAAKVDYAAAIKEKVRISHIAFERFKSGVARAGYDEFCAQNADWLDDFSLYMSLRADAEGRLWNTWAPGLRDREPAAMNAAREKFAPQIERKKFLQFMFHRQWFALKKYCNDRKIKFIGDIPFYVNLDSSDVWTNPSLFKLSPDKKPLFVSGVPPDYFSKTGQRWGNPVYDWDRLKSENYLWWKRRLAQNFALFDIVRIDHFRGFAAYWEIPVHEETAVNGRWVPVDGNDFFSVVGERFGRLPIIAEDLGVITDDVRELINRFSFPGMRILLFAFGGDFPRGSYLPHRYERNCVVYTGTHDNNTARGWFEGEITPEEKERLLKYAGCQVKNVTVGMELIRLAMASVADTALFPMQDVAGLNESARMNMPGTRDGNWQWRLPDKHLSPSCAQELYDMTAVYDRLP